MGVLIERDGFLEFMILIGFTYVYKECWKGRQGGRFVLVIFIDTDSFGLRNSRSLWLFDEATVALNTSNFRQ